MLLKLCLVAMSVVACQALMAKSANVKSDGISERRKLQNNDRLAQESLFTEFQPYESFEKLQEPMGSHESFIQDPMSVAAS